MAQKIIEYSRLLTLQLQWDWGGAQLSGASLKPINSLPMSVIHAFFYSTVTLANHLWYHYHNHLCVSIWNTRTSDNKRCGDELTFFGGEGRPQHDHQRVMSGHYILDYHSFAVFQIIQLSVIKGLQYSFKLQINHVWSNHIQKHNLISIRGMSHALNYMVSKISNFDEF